MLSVICFGVLDNGTRIFFTTLPTIIFSPQCEVFCVWAITHVSEKTTTYLNATNNFHEDEIDESTIVTYTHLLDETSHKYEEMICS
eukprot:3125840-Ditylum_brightwellii.AAC.1